MKDLNISRTAATVVHSNKYSQNAGVVISFVFVSNFFQDVVFKLDETGDEFPTTLKNVNLPLFTGQKVTLLAIDDNVIAYVDQSTNEFHYLTNNLQRDLKFGLSISWNHIIALTVLGFISASVILPENYIAPLIIIGFPFCFWFYQRVANFLLERKIDRIILNS